jgi:alpha-galactosidase
MPIPTRHANTESDSLIMTSKLLPIIALLGLAAALPTLAAEIDIPDYSLAPNGLNETTTFQHTDVSTPNGGQVLPTGTPKTAYVITTFTFGSASDAHLQWQFSTSSTAANRLGVEIQDTGLVQFLGTNDTTRTNFNFNQDMAGQTVVLLAKLSFDANNNVTYGKANASDDTIMNVWINPTGSDVEGSPNSLSAGDMSTIWNSAGFSYFRQTIQNQNTPGTSGTSSITNTTILTGTDATWSNALSLATGGTPPGPVDAATSTVSASPTAVPADGTSTSTITVTLKDAANIPVAGKEVSLTGSGSAVITTGNNISNASGVVTFTVRSNTVGVQQFAATDVTDSNLAITQTASVDFQTPVVIGPVSAGNSTVTASPASVVANGITTSTITVTLKDSNGLLIANEGVTLSGNPSGATITPAGAQTTNANGQSAFNVKSSTIGPVVFTATSVTDSVTITQTANVNFTDPLLAQAFNVNFLDDGQANATGLVGVIGSAGETWNQGTGSGAGAISNLIDTTGTVVSSVGVSGLGDDGRPISGTSLSLFNANRGFFGKGQDTTIQITGLTPNTPFDIHIYSLSHATTSWGNISETERAAGNFVTTNTVLGNGQSQWLDNGKAGTNGNSFVPNGNYVTFQSIVSSGSGAISILVDAHDGIDGLANTNDGNTRLHVCGLQIRPASGMSVDYMNWRNASYPGLGLPDADDDGDGLSNEYEHIFGLNPTSSASSNPYPTPFDSASGSFSYSRRTQSLINMNYKVWYSTDLEDWFVDNAASQLPQSAANGVEIMGVRIDPNLLDEPKLFVQVRATPITGIDPEPSLLNIRGSGNTITLIFSEPMNPSSAGNPYHYSVVQGTAALNITNATVSSDGGSVTLTLASPLGIDTGYTVSVDGVTSGTGQSLGVVSRPFRTWDDNPNGIKVFILAGQSNMVGRGESERGNGDVNGAIGSLRYQVVNDNANYGQLVANTGNPATAPWVVRNDVKFWWNRADIGAGANISKGGLNPQGFGSGPATFGPEYGFGWAVGDSTSQPVLLIKTAWGGKDLITNFRPPGAVAARGGVVGGYYIEMLEQVREILFNLNTEFPAAQHPEFAAVGYRYQIAGFGWHQGWNDSLDTFASNEYEANMANFITDIRAEFGKPNLPFSIGTTGMEGVATSGNRLTVVNAQINVANPTLHPELGGNVFTIDTRPFARTTAQSPTNDTTHWKNNGESMYLIGKGMGDGIVDLLGP